MSSIEYLEIREMQSNYTLELVGIVDEFSSLIWHTCYNSSGDFEIYAPLNDNNDALLKIGNYVTRSDRKDPQTGDIIPRNDMGIIESVTKSFTLNEGYMITATGRMVDSLLDKRIIIKIDVNGKPNPTTIGIAENNTKNVQQAISSIIGTQTKDTARAIPIIESLQSFSKSEAEFDSTRQVTYDNLLTYIQTTLQEFNLGICGQLYNNKVRIYQYAGRETDLVFSTEWDNLISCEYSLDDSTRKTTALVGGEGEGVDRAIAWVNEGVQGYERREIFVDDTSITKTWTDDEGTEHEYTTEEFQKMLKERGTLELSKSKSTTTIAGELNVTTSGIEFREDFYLGDVVTIENDKLGITARVRILEVTEVQDADGYRIDMVFGG